MQFITILETNHKENEMFIHYCQWTGNEEELGKLLKIIEFADPSDMDGDYSDFCYSDTKVTEEAVDQHVHLPYGNYDHMFQKHTGMFECPEFDYIRDEYEAARMLDGIFFGCKLGSYFKSK